VRSPEYDQRVHAEGIWLRFLSGPDIESLGISRAEIIDAVADVVTAHGRGQTVFEPRVHLRPDNGGAGAGTMLRYH
jgi:ornithine cyclodeaminase